MKDELKIKTKGMRDLVGKKVTKYLKKKGIDIDLMLNDIDAETREDGSINARVDMNIVITPGQLVRMI